MTPTLQQVFHPHSGQPPSHTHTHTLAYTSVYSKYTFSLIVCFTFIFSRAVKVSALIYAINVAAINALKYFNAINATLFTSGVRCPLTRNRRVPT